MKKMRAIRTIVPIGMTIARIMGIFDGSSGGGTGSWPLKAASITSKPAKEPPFFKTLLIFLYPFVKVY
jgi:hypothetical protein